MFDGAIEPTNFVLHQIQKMGVLLGISGRCELGLETLQAHGHGVERVAYFMGHCGRHVAELRKPLFAVDFLFQRSDFLQVPPLIIEDGADAQDAHREDAEAEDGHRAQTALPSRFRGLQREPDLEKSQRRAIDPHRLDDIKVAAAVRLLDDLAANSLVRFRLD